MKSKYLTAAISVAPFVLTFLIGAFLNYAPNHWLSWVAIFNLSMAWFIVIFPSIDAWYNSKAKAAWREILGGDREGD